MRNGLLASVATLLVGAGLVLAQDGLPGPRAVVPMPLSSYAAADTGSAAEPAPEVKPVPSSAPSLAPAAGHLPPGAVNRDGGPCPEPCFGCTDGGQGGRFWAQADYLLWWLRESKVPPLVTTGPAQFPVGILGNPGTVVLVEGDDLDIDAFNGGRFSAAYLFGGCKPWGIMGSYFFLGERSNSAELGSTGYPVLTRPFTRADTGNRSSEFAAFPGQSVGAIRIDSNTRLQGAELNVFCPLCCCDWTDCCTPCCADACGGFDCPQPQRTRSYRVDLFGGFRYLDLDEDLDILEVAQFSPTSAFPGLAGNTFRASDEFATRNRFYGGQFGLSASVVRGRFIVDFRGSVALGNTHQEIDIAGSQVRATPDGGLTRFRGGLLALPTNIGHHERDEFSVVPEVGINFGYRLTNAMSVHVGYSFLYWTDVLRPGDQIDTVLDARQIPNFIVPPVSTAGARRPAVLFRESDFWAQGINFGFQLNY